ncbi:hypothetical protein [Immundisolibacter sp.]|uniref:hypothetical protein n=1 Tax=Immundisolibacter sp. TaxID=1934948 RepID=UPI003566071A
MTNHGNHEISVVRKAVLALLVETHATICQSRSVSGEVLNKSADLPTNDLLFSGGLLKVSARQHGLSRHLVKPSLTMNKGSPKQSVSPAPE